MRTVWKGFAGLLALAVAGGGVWWWTARPPGGDEGRPERPPPAVVLAEVARAPVVRTLEAVGSTVAAESVDVGAKSPGRITSVEFTDGQRVERGKVLVRLDAEEARAELAAVQAESAEVGQALARAEELLARGSGARAPVDDARRRLQAANARVASAQKRLEDTEVRAPFAGRVGLREVSLGAIVDPSTVLATLDSISPIALRMSVPEQALGGVAPGTRIRARSAAYPDREEEGEIHAVASRVDPALRTISVEARLPNPDGRLLPGMLMNVTIDLETIADAVVAPPMAVLVRGDRQFVYRIRDGKAERAPVEIGQRTPDGVHVVRGLEAGERIVVEGLAGIAEGKPVRVVERGPEPGGTPPGGEEARGGDPAATGSTAARPRS